MSSEPIPVLDSFALARLEQMRIRGERFCGNTDGHQPHTFWTAGSRPIYNRCYACPGKPRVRRTA